MIACSLLPKALSLYHYIQLHNIQFSSIALSSRRVESPFKAYIARALHRVAAIHFAQHIASSTAVNCMKVNNRGIEKAYGVFSTQRLALAWKVLISIAKFTYPRRGTTQKIGTTALGEQHSLIDEGRSCRSALLAVFCCAGSSLSNSDVATLQPRVVVMQNTSLSLNATHSALIARRRCTHIPDGKRKVLYYSLEHIYSNGQRRLFL